MQNWRDNLVFVILYIFLPLFLYSPFRFSGEEMNDELDKVRKEHGWKPRRRGKSQVWFGKISPIVKNLINNILNYCRLCIHFVLFHDFLSLMRILYPYTE